MSRRFSVWAPNASRSMHLVTADGRQPMRPGSDGWWHLNTHAGAGTEYSFSIDGGDPLPDPRALRLPAGPEGPAMTYDHEAYSWSDASWRGVALPGAVVYELHIGTFTPDGTLDAAVDRLDHLVALGVDFVELLPVATFPGRHGWGYDGVGLYAVHEPYGGPDALKRFVDACHARGLGVCLDVVYNHLGPSGNHLAEFGPYFTDAHTVVWGQAVNLDGPGSDHVRRFVVDNATMWLRDFHIDALRLDAVHALHDGRAVPILEKLSAEVDALATSLGRPLWLVAESDRNDPSTVTPREAGGLGIHAQWDDDVHHALHVLLTGEEQGYYADFHQPGAVAKVLTGAFFHDGTYSSFRGRHHGRPVDRERTPGWRFVVSLQTHDQVGNRAQGDRLSSLVGPDLLACGAALLLTGPFTPMLFMGEEWGARTSWEFFTDHTDPEVAAATGQGRVEEFAQHGWDPADVPDPQDPAAFERSRLDWSELDDDRHAALLRWYRDLIRLRWERADLRDPRLSAVRVDHDRAAGTVVVRRGRHRVVVNVSDTARDVRLNADHDTDEEPAVLLAWRSDGVEVTGPDRVRLSAGNACVVGPEAPPGMPPGQAQPG